MTPNPRYYKRTVVRTVTVLEVWDAQGNQVNYVERNGSKIRDVQIGKIQTQITKGLDEMSEEEIALFVNANPEIKADA